MNENRHQDNNRTNNIRRRYIIEPLDTSTMNHKKYTKFKSLTLSELAIDATDLKKRLSLFTDNKDDRKWSFWSTE